MKQIKIFEHASEMVLEEYVNRFLAEHPVSVDDIQFRVVAHPHLTYIAMVVYDSTLAKLDKWERECYERVNKAGESE